MLIFFDFTGLDSIVVERLENRGEKSKFFVSSLFKIGVKKMAIARILFHSKVACSVTINLNVKGEKFKHPTSNNPLIGRQKLVKMTVDCIKKLP